MADEDAGSDDDPEPIKPVFWTGSSKDDLREFPADVQDIMGFALYQAQIGGKHRSAKPLKGFRGSSVLEIVADERGNTYRGIYTVRFAGALYVLDAFQKKSKKGVKTPQRDMDRLKQRLSAAELHYEGWRLAQQQGGEKK